MQGRLEHELKTQQSTDEVVKSMPDFVQEWYVNLKASRKTAASCYDYTIKVRNFLQYIGNDDLNVSTNQITLQACESYLIMNQTKVSNNGMIVYTSDSYQIGIWYALNNFLSFLKNRQYIPENYMQYISKPKNQDLQRINNDRLLLTQKDFHKIIQCALNSNTQTKKTVPLKNRDIAILLIFMTTGIRKTALSELNVNDFDRSDGTLRVVDKGNVYQHFPLNSMTLEYLHKWLIDRTKFSIQNHDALFLNYDGERITQRGIVKIVQKYSEKALGFKISPHKLRAGFCSILYDKTNDIEFVRRAVGHANISTTQRYIKTTKDEKKIASKIIEDYLL